MNLENYPLMFAKWSDFHLLVRRSAASTACLSAEWPAVADRRYNLCCQKVEVTLF